MKPHFEIVRFGPGMFSWRLVTEEGKPIIECPSYYRTKKKALNDINSVCEAVKEATQIRICNA